MKIDMKIKELVGASAVGIAGTLVDIVVLYLLYEHAFAHNQTSLTMAVCVAISFTFGVTVNYTLATLFVFNNERQRQYGRNLRGVALYFLVFFVGFWLTEGLMWAGVKMVGDEGLRYLIVKVVVSSLVFFWNFIARKVFVYRGA